ncbi:DoxX family protein [Streptomyces mirabilis]|uniref:DoxX family protein n=1 Tax=Streptomyces mirabilis TaxID=68239 RepID=UPI0036E3C154
MCCAPAARSRGRTAGHRLRPRPPPAGQPPDRHRDFPGQITRLQTQQPLDSAARHARAPPPPTAPPSPACDGTRKTSPATCTRRGPCSRWCSWPSSTAASRSPRARACSCWASARNPEQSPGGLSAPLVRFIGLAELGVAAGLLIGLFWQPVGIAAAVGFGLLLIGAVRPRKGRGLRQPQDPGQRDGTRLADGRRRRCCHHARPLGMEKISKRPAHHHPAFPAEQFPHCLPSLGGGCEGHGPACCRHSPGPRRRRSLSDGRGARPTHPLTSAWAIAATASRQGCGVCRSAAAGPSAGGSTATRFPATRPEPSDPRTPFDALPSDRLTVQVPGRVGRRRRTSPSRTVRRRR